MKTLLKYLLLVFAAILTITCLTVARSSISNVLAGKVHFPEEHVGELLTTEDGRQFTVFRRLVVEGRDDRRKTPAVFRVRFKFRNLGIETNKRLSAIPAVFLMGMEGFLEKNWAIHEATNEFLGIYQWSSKEAAARYPDSFIFKLLTKRAASESMSYEVLPETDLAAYRSSLSK